MRCATQAKDFPSYTKSKKTKRAKDKKEEKEEARETGVAEQEGRNMRSDGARGGRLMDATVAEEAPEAWGLAPGLCGRLPRIGVRRGDVALAGGQGAVPRRFGRRLLLPGRPPRPCPGGEEGSGGTLRRSWSSPGGILPSTPAATVVGSTKRTCSSTGPVPVLTEGAERGTGAGTAASSFSRTGERTCGAVSAAVAGRRRV